MIGEFFYVSLFLYKLCPMKDIAIKKAIQNALIQTFDLEVIMPVFHYFEHKAKYPDTTFDTKLHPVLELKRVWSNLSLPLFTGSLWFGEGAPVRFPSMSQIDLLKMIHIKLDYFILYNCMQIICIKNSHLKL